MNKTSTSNQLELTGHRMITLGLAVVSLILFLILAANIWQHGINEIDRSIMLFVYELRTSLLTVIMKWATFFGSTGLILVALLVVLTLFIKRYLQQTIWFLVLVGSGAVINAVLKILVARPRPTLAPLIRETDFSFPSGHAMDSLIVYGAIAYLLFRLIPKSRHRAFVLPMTVLIIGVIGFSRIYLGVHYPSDVLAGYLFGAGWLLLGMYFYSDIDRDRRVSL